MPPKGILDGHPQGNVGCKNLLQALRRIKPLMHYFGHIHEGNGVEVVHWADEESGGSSLANREQDWWKDHENKGKLGNTYPEPTYAFSSNIWAADAHGQCCYYGCEEPTNKCGQENSKSEMFHQSTTHSAPSLRPFASRVRATVSKF